MQTSKLQCYILVDRKLINLERMQKDYIKLTRKGRYHVMDIHIP